jgi:predicted nuclease with TOPRIM domain
MEGCKECEQLRSRARELGEKLFESETECDELGLDLDDAIAQIASQQETMRHLLKEVFGLEETLKKVSYETVALERRIAELEGDNAVEIEVLTDDLTKAHDEIAQQQSKQ